MILQGRQKNGTETTFISFSVIFGVEIHRQYSSRGLIYTFKMFFWEIEGKSVKHVKQKGLISLLLYRIYRNFAEVKQI